MIAKYIFVAALAFSVFGCATTHRAKYGRRHRAPNDAQQTFQMDPGARAQDTRAPIWDPADRPSVEDSARDRDYSMYQQQPLPPPDKPDKPDPPSFPGGSPPPDNSPGGFPR